MRKRLHRRSCHSFILWCAGVLAFISCFVLNQPLSATARSPRSPISSISVSSAVQNREQTAQPFFPFALSQTSANPSANQRVQQGLTLFQAGQWEGAIAEWQQALIQVHDRHDRATIHNNMAQAYRELGQLDRAIAEWEEAVALYRAIGASSNLALAAVWVEQAQTYNELGQYRRVMPLLEKAGTIAHTQNDRLLQAVVQGTRGDAHTMAGDYGQALSAYQTSIQHAEALNHRPYLTVVRNNLGNLYLRLLDRARYQRDLAEREGETSVVQTLTQQITETITLARSTYEQSWRDSQSVSSMAEVTALLNLNRFYAQSDQPSDRDRRAPNHQRILALLASQPPSRTKAYAFIHLAHDADATQRPTLLEQALTVSRAIGDRRTESFALGGLGKLAEQKGQIQTAIAWTEQAQLAAQQVNAADSLYQWQWQSGRLYAKQGETDRAIQIYEHAIATLQNIRGDIISANRDLQFSFRDSVEPVYRELMALLLTPNSPTTNFHPPSQKFVGAQGFAPSTQAVQPAIPNSIHPSSASKNRDKSPQSTEATNIRKVLNYLEQLKLAELQNFFGDECVQVARTQAKETSPIADPTAVVIYSVLLPDHTEMIVRSPNGDLTHHAIALTLGELRTQVETLRRFLEKRSTEEYLESAKAMYQALIQPLESDLARLKPKTLAFVNDGALRTIPMAALHDGQKFLIETYAIANAPSINLTAGGSLDRTRLNALTAGLTLPFPTTARSDVPPEFAALDNVAAETRDVKAILGGVELLDRNFTINKLKAQFSQQNFPIVHIATHGKFGIDAASTFIVAYDQKVSLEDIDRLIRSRQGDQPVEILTLSACQTAAGDDRAALGIAGVAVRAGVKSALATLWYINDADTLGLIRGFYQNLRQPGNNKSDALRLAQLDLIHDPDTHHPAVWSPFILVGNWL